MCALLELTGIHVVQCICYAVKTLKEGVIIDVFRVRSNSVEVSYGIEGRVHILCRITCRGVLGFLEGWMDGWMDGMDGWMDG